MNKKQKAALLAAARAELENELLPERAFWAGILGFEDLLTGDGRFIEKNALEWETPAPLRYVRADVGAHDGAEVAGRILKIERRDDGTIWGAGDFDLGSEAGREAYRQVSEGYTTGISMDLDNVSFEVRVAAELMNRFEASDEGNEEEETSDDGRVIVMKVNPDDEVFATTSAGIRAATLVSIPAFKDAKISTTEETEELLALRESAAQPSALIASAIPVEPPHEWFENPKFSELTPMTVTDEGRVFGYLAAWGVCHIGNPSGANVCVEAPASPSDYAYFHTGAIKTSEGAIIPVGQITMATGHANPRANAKSTAAHYDNTGTAIADVRVGEDEFGIWIAGALRSTATPEQIRELRAAPLSGDWRRIGGELELVAALAVNVQGFPIPRPKGLVASGEVNTIVAAGMVAPGNSSRDALAELGLTELDIEHLLRLADRERMAAQKSLAVRARAHRNRQRVAEFVAGRK